MFVMVDRKEKKIDLFVFRNVFGDLYGVVVFFILFLELIRWFLEFWGWWESFVGVGDFVSCFRRLNFLF